MVVCLVMYLNNSKWWIEDQRLKIVREVFAAIFDPDYKISCCVLNTQLVMFQRLLLAMFQNHYWLQFKHITRQVLNILFASLKTQQLLCFRQAIAQDSNIFTCYVSHTMFAMFHSHGLRCFTHVICYDLDTCACDVLNTLSSMF